MKLIGSGHHFHVLTGSFRFVVKLRDGIDGGAGAASVLSVCIVQVVRAALRHQQVASTAASDGPHFCLAGKKGKVETLDDFCRPLERAVVFEFSGFVVGECRRGESHG